MFVTLLFVCQAGRRVPQKASNVAFRKFSIAQPFCKQMKMENPELENPDSLYLETGNYFSLATPLKPSIEFEFHHGSQNEWQGGVEKGDSKSSSSF